MTDRRICVTVTRDPQACGWLVWPIIRQPSIFIGPGFHVDSTGIVTLTAGRRIVVSPESSVEDGGRLELGLDRP